MHVQVKNWITSVSPMTKTKLRLIKFKIMSMYVNLSLRITENILLRIGSMVIPL